MRMMDAMTKSRPRRPMTLTTAGSGHREHDNVGIFQMTAMARSPPITGANFWRSQRSRTKATTAGAVGMSDGAGEESVELPSLTACASSTCNSRQIAAPPVPMKVRLPDPGNLDLRARRG